jgi:hypothetical protein
MKRALSTVIVLGASTLFFTGCATRASNVRYGPDGRERVVDSGRRLMQSLTDRSYDTAVVDFDRTMRQALPPARLKMIWEKILAANGALQAWEPQAGSDLWVRKYSLTFATARLTAVVDFDPASSLVSGFHFFAVESARRSETGGS